jgi:hypothetical protein
MALLVDVRSRVQENVDQLAALELEARQERRLAKIGAWEGFVEPLFQVRMAVEQLREARRIHGLSGGHHLCDGVDRLYGGGNMRLEPSPAGEAILPCEGVLGVGEACPGIRPPQLAQ